MMGCPPAVALADLLSRVAEERPPELLAHLAACAECRAEALALARAEAEEATGLPHPLRSEWLALLVKAPRPRRLAWRAAAAALLLAAAGAWSLWRPAVRPEPSPPTPSPSAVAQPRFLVLGQAASAELAPGSRLVPAGGNGLSFALESGEARLESLGERLELSVGKLCVSFEEGQIEAGWQTAAAVTGGWLPSAWAEASGTPFVRVIRGRAGLRLGAGPERWLEAGWEASPAGEDLRLRQADTGPSGWRSLLESERALRGEVWAPEVPPGEEYRFEAVLRKSAPGAECAVIFPAGGACYEIALGSALPKGGWIRVAMEVRQGRATVVAGPHVLADAGLAELPLKAYPAPAGAGLGVRAWGGDVVLQSARWRAMP